MTICYHWLCWISLLDFGCHAVDDNNNNHQGWLSFEESFTFDYWDLRQFGFIVTISHVHTMLANNYFCCSHGSNSIYNKTTLTRELASLSIFGSEDFEDIQCLSGGTIREQSKQIATKRIVRAIFIWKSFGVDENPAHWSPWYKLWEMEWNWISNGEHHIFLLWLYNAMCERVKNTFFCKWTLMTCSKCHGKNVEASMRTRIRILDEYYVIWFYCVHFLMTNM